MKSARSLLLLFMFILPFFLGAQAKAIIPITVTDSLYRIYPYDISMAEGQNFPDIITEKSFNPPGTSVPKNHRSIWFRFYVRPQTKAWFLGFLPSPVDRADLYVPMGSGYRKYTSGRLSTIPIHYDILESMALYIPANLPDYKRPFYLHLRNKADPQAVPSKPGLMNLSGTKIPLHYHILRTGKTRKYQIYLGIIALASLLFFLSFVITRDRHFMYYSFYLLALLGVFVHQIPFLHNFLAHIYPLLPGLVIQTAIVATALAYFWFVVRLLETERYAPGFRPLIRLLITLSVIYAVFRIWQSVFRPSFSYTYMIYLAFNVFFMAVSLFIFSVLWFRPVPRIKKIIILGSYLLVAGHLFSLVFKDDFYFLNTVLAEIALFYTIIFLQYRRVHEERLRYKWQMLAEQQKRENLMVLDEMKTRFFSHISHEFRTPLTLMEAALNRLQETVAGPPARKFVNNLRRQAGRLRELMDQLMDISRLQARALKPQNQTGDLKTFVAMVCENFRTPAQNKGVAFLPEIDINDSPYLFDKDFLQKILSNLLSNAIKYTPGGGSVWCHAATDNDHFLFEIENTGKGLTPEQQKRIFERFYQIDPHAEGMGLGLSLVKELVGVLGGSISVESEQGKRTRFLVQIPLEKPAEIPEKNPSPQPEQVSGDQPVLLILEDHPEVREYIAGLFRDQYTVMEAASAAEAWEKTVQTLPNLIVSDIMMPGEDGFSFCRRLKSDIRTAHIPLIFLTAKTEQADKQQAASCGAHDLVVKPFDEKVLKHKVQNLLDMLKRHRRRYRQEIFLTPKDLAITPLDEKFLEKMEKILEERLSDPAFGVEELARAMHMSRMQLHRKIKALTGLPASDFLRSQRLKHAARLMKTTDLSVNEIAYQSGFNNPSYFVRRFKQAYGMTPGEYRNKGKNKDKHLFH